MAFYTAEYIKKLLIDDQAQVKKVLATKDADLRTYIDRTLPFTLLIDIDKIISLVATEASEFVTAASAASGEPPAKIAKALVDTYKKFINFYIDTTPTISSKELEDKLNKFNLSVESGSRIVTTLKQEFSKTYVISNLSRRNKSVLFISPSFKTIQTSFGSDFRKLFDLSIFSDERRNNGELDSPRSVIIAFLKNDFGKLQNLGHAEYDIISSSTNEVKRGIVTPKLLSAILSLPKGVSPTKLARKFSSETGQATSRVIVRKKYAGSKLVLEMLIESGFLLGAVESREENLKKAPLERAFSIGAGITKTILKNPGEFFGNLSTSKTLINRISDEFLGAITNKKVAQYASTKTVVATTKIKIPRVNPLLPKSTGNGSSTIKVANTVRTTVPLINLESILRASINQQVARNMGNGSESRILNYRTGRLAESVTIDRVSESRQGMISVFYNYMKNPYATFSEGGRQQSPKTRDPKTLISKSIRELAAPIVGNRLRSVLV